MKYTCIVVDDEPIARELIEEHLSHLEQFELVGAFENAIKTKAFLDQNKVDLMFLDIEMPLIKGTEFLRMRKDWPAVIFTTAYREYALESYDLNVLDYLLKPITFERFFVAIEKFTSQAATTVATNTPSPFLFIPTAGKKMKIIPDELLYLESFRDYVTIHLEGQKSHHIKYSITEFEKLLPAYCIRVHRSYVVNSQKVDAYSKQEIDIRGVTIPIGDKYKASWEKMFE